MVDVVDIEQLSPSQQEALQQYTQVTDQDLGDAVPLLARSQWNVQIAIAKFFDGEGPDPFDEAAAVDTTTTAAAPVAEPLIAPPRAENLQESLGAGPFGRSHRAPRSDPAPRIVPRKPDTTRLPWLFALLLTPFSVGWRVASTFLRTIVYVLSYLPVSIRPRSLHGAISPGFRSTTGRRMLMPRDTAARFKREFEEEYGSSELPWFEGGIAQAHDLAKKDLKFLLVVLVSPEHDDTEAFTRETLLSPDVVAFIRDPSNNIILWGGNVLDSEAYQVAQEYNCTKYPFSAVVCLTPKEGGSTRMGIVKRLAGPVPPASYIGDMRSVMERYGRDLDGLRAQRTAQELSRNLRSEQDDAYERSLARDRERARQRREAEAAAAEAERRAERDAEAARMLEDRRQQWRRWRAASVPPEPAAGEPGLVRLALKLPEALSAGRVVRRFRADAKMEELYAFVECFDLLHKTPLDEKAASKPQGYEHDFGFRIASVMPRVVLHPSDTETIGATVGRSGNLIVEFMDEASEA